MRNYIKVILSLLCFIAFSVDAYAQSIVSPNGTNTTTTALAASAGDTVYFTIHTSVNYSEVGLRFSFNEYQRN